MRLFDLRFVPLVPLCNSEAISCLLAAAGEAPEQQAGMLMIVSTFKIFEPLTVWAHAKIIQQIQGMMNILFHLPMQEGFQLQLLTLFIYILHKETSLVLP